MRRIFRKIAAMFRPGGSVAVVVGHCPGFVIIRMDSPEGLASADEAREIAGRLMKAADNAERRGQLWGITAGRVPEKGK